MKKVGLLLPALLLLHWKSFGVQLPPMTLLQLQDSIEILIENRHIPGLFLTMVTPDSILWQGGIGTADIANQQSVNKSTLFKMGSVTKSFAALAILKLVEQGKLSLNDKISNLAPELSIKNAWKATHPVRVVHLLEHTAGLDDIHLHAGYRARQPKLSTKQLARAHEKSLYCRWRPGTCHSYTNVGYVVLSYLIEKVSGKPYQDFLTEAILQPLAMSRSTVDLFSTSANEAKGYQFDTSNGIQAVQSSIRGALAGDLKSCAQDMTQLLYFFLNDGKRDSTQVVSRSGLQRMESTGTTRAARAGLAHYYGLGNTLGHPGAKVVFRGHGGSVPGFVSYYGYNREAGIGYAVAINGEAGLYPIRKLIVDFLTQDMEAKDRAQFPISSLNEKYVASFLGYYQYNSSKDKIGAAIDKLEVIRLLLKDDRLYLQHFMEKPWELVPVSGSTFRYTTTHLSTVALVLDDEGSPVVATLDGYYERTSFVKVILTRIVSIGFIATILSILPFGFVWLVLWWKKKISSKEAILRLAPVVTVGVALATLLAAAYLFVYQRHTIGSVSTWEVIVYLGSMVFPVLAGASLLLAIYRLVGRRQVILSYYLLLVTLSLNSIAIYLATADLIGFRFWNY